MTSAGSDRSFEGAVPQAYERYLVPLLFEPYAADLAARLVSLDPHRLLEVAAGTGVVTRALASALAERASIVATDLNPPMLAHAASLGTARPVEWKTADAMRLPFEDGTFDAAVCQFGVMFFPDRAGAFAEAKRVLKPGGSFLFSSWGGLLDNELAHAAQDGLARMFPQDPPRFMERVPHGYGDASRIEADLAAGGFESPRIETVALRSRARSARDAAVAFCHGTPLRHEIETRAPGRLDEATAAAEDEIARRFGRDAIDAKMQALVVTVAR